MCDGFVLVSNNLIYNDLCMPLENADRSEDMQGYAELKNVSKRLEMQIV